MSDKKKKPTLAEQQEWANGFTYEEMHAEVMAELAIRKNFYAKQIEAGRMKKADAAKKFKRMRAVAGTLAKLMILNSGELPLVGKTENTKKEGIPD